MQEFGRICLRMYLKVTSWMKPICLRVPKKKMVLIFNLSSVLLWGKGEGGLQIVSTLLSQPFCIQHKFLSHRCSAQPPNMLSLHFFVPINIPPTVLIIITAGKLPHQSVCVCALMQISNCAAITAVFCGLK